MELPLLLLFLTTSVLATIPNELPQDKRDYLSNLQNIFLPMFRFQFPTRGGARFSVLSFDDAGRQAEFRPPVGNRSFSEEEPVNVVARSWQYGRIGKRHAEIVIIEDYLENMLQQYRTEYDGNDPLQVNLLINVFNCKSRCAELLVDVFGRYGNISFNVGYKHMHAKDPERIFEILGQATNLYFGDVSGAATFYRDRGPYVSVESFEVEPVQAVLYGAQIDFKRGPPPEGPGDDWSSRAELIGLYGWENFNFLFFHPLADLYGVFYGNMYKDSPPDDSGHNWLGNSETVGINIWSDYQFLFFDHFGNLYAVHESGIYRGRAPMGNNNAVWTRTSTAISTYDWTSFQFLFFHPSDFMLYGVLEGNFYRGSPPQGTMSPNEWIDTVATCIGTGGWDGFTQLFFHPNGLLYAAGMDGTLRAGVPPQYPTDNWLGRSTLLGEGNWNEFNFLFFHPRLNPEPIWLKL